VAVLLGPGDAGFQVVEFAGSHHGDLAFVTLLGHSPDGDDVIDESVGGLQSVRFGE
jgi:hypothetical protein